MHCNKGWKCCSQMDGTYKIILMPQPFAHYGKKVCAHCGHYMSWIPDPKITKQVEERNIEIDRLLAIPAINENEKVKEFLTSIRDKRFITPRQRMYYENVSIRHPK